MSDTVIHCYVKGKPFLCIIDIQQKSELHASSFGSNQHSFVMLLNPLALNASYKHMHIQKMQCDAKNTNAT
jgi:hypothetical protein